MCLCRVVFYVNSIVWWQLLRKEAVGWQGTGFPAQPSAQGPRFWATSGAQAQEGAGTLDKMG